MKIILSRKGFDSENGGYPSPILPDGRLISLPIPSEDGICYSELKLDDTTTYFDLINGLNSNMNDIECHLDPDIYRNVTDRLVGWKPIFGQINGSQTHLMNEGVKEGDLFLFFGWFKQTILKNGKLEFDKSAPDLHIIFGYLQIGKILQVNNQTKIPDWMKYHPHARDEDRLKNPTNTVYVAADNLMWDNNTPGAGVFKFSKELVLTKDGFSRSKWELPNFFRNVKMSKHRQEKVVEDNSDVENWAKELIKQNEY